MGIVRLIIVQGMRRWDIIEMIIIIIIIIVLFDSLFMGDINYLLKTYVIYSSLLNTLFTFISLS